MRKNGNVVLIAPREELALKEKQQFESAAQISDLEPLQTEMFQLNYAKAQDILNLVSSNRSSTGGGDARGGQGSILSRRGVATLDPRSNILFVQDTPSRLEEVRRSSGRSTCRCARS
jgi:type IV pilus assembly protein PilQ